MNFKEKKFAYRHKPTGKWVHLLSYNSYDIDMFLVDDFCSEMTYIDKLAIQEDLLRSRYKKEEYASQNFLEFELVEIEAEYKIKA